MKDGQVRHLFSELQPDLDVGSVNLANMVSSTGAQL